jgi:hypothetical protein
MCLLCSTGVQNALGTANADRQYPKPPPARAVYWDACYGVNLGCGGGGSQLAAVAFSVTRRTLLLNTCLNPSVQTYRLYSIRVQINIVPHSARCEAY